MTNHCDELEELSKAETRAKCCRSLLCYLNIQDLDYDTVKLTKSIIPNRDYIKSGLKHLAETNKDSMRIYANRSTNPIINAIEDIKSLEYFYWNHRADNGQQSPARKIQLLMYSILDTLEKEENE